MVSMDQTDRDYPGCVCDDGIFTAGGIPFLYRLCDRVCAVSATQMAPAQAASVTGSGRFRGAVCRHLCCGTDRRGDSVPAGAGRQLCGKMRSAGRVVFTGAHHVEHVL